VLTGVLVVGGFSLGVHLHNLHNGVIAASFTAVGLVVGLKRPGHRMADLFMATGVSEAVIFFGRQFGTYIGTHPGVAFPGAAWVTWLGVWPLALVLVVFGVTIMSFPDGRLPSHRWRVVVAAMTAAGVILAVVSALWPVEYATDSLVVTHPFRLPGYGLVREPWVPAAQNIYLLDQIAWVVCVVSRLRGAEGDEAEQLKWFVYSVVVGLMVMIASVVFLASPVAGVLAVPIIPVAAGIAIVKFRLYDIDLVINKTLVVGSMGAVITAIYVAVVVGAGAMLGLSTQSNLWLSLLATTVVALAFEPLRQRVQRAANRLVYGHRATPYEALARLSAQLSVQSRHTDLLASVVSSLAEGIGATEATLWVGSEAELVAMATWPSPDDQHPPRAVVKGVSALSDGRRSHVQPIIQHGEVRGAITVTKAGREPLRPTENRLLSDIAAQAGLVIDNVGLSAELGTRLQQISAQSVELRAAAKRIVSAQDAARRRIERDLHDGAQQSLVTLAMTLQSVSQSATAANNGELVADLDQARHQLAQALVELREMARGIHPAILTEAGLEAALGFLAERSAVPVHLNIRLGSRILPEVEATAYFVVSESLTNAAKHSGASAIVVSVDIEDDHLLIEIADQGSGGADGHWGSGLQGLADRLATLHGVLTVVSPSGEGTRIRAEIPCG